MKHARSPVVAAAVLLAAATVLPGAAAADDATKVKTDSEYPYDVYLTDSEGHSLYLFKADSKGKSSACTGACAKAWPPLTTKAKPKTSGTLDASLAGTIKREDGSTQVTFNGWPLYLYAKDKEPGDVNGHDVHGFGGEWYLVGHDGDPVEETKNEDGKKKEG